MTDNEQKALEYKIKTLEEENRQLRYANQAWAHECSRLNALVKPNVAEAIELLKRAAALIEKP